MDTSEHTLVLSRTKVAELGTTKDYLTATRTAFADMANQRYVLPSVGHIPADDGAFHIKTASRQGPASLAVIKVNGNFPDNPLKHGLPTIQGLVALLDAERGSVLALVDSVEITARRTAATPALATEYLARPGSNTLGIVGGGMVSDTRRRSALNHKLRNSTRIQAVDLRVLRRQTDKER